MNRRVAAILLALLGGGCSTVRHAPPSLKVTATTASVPVPSAAMTLPSHPEAIYRNPKIGAVHLRAYQGEDGRLYGPQIVYQITEPGGWNVEALDQDGAYIPAANLDLPASANSPNILPARAAPPLPADAPMLDPAKSAQIVITGLMRKSDLAQAEAMAREEGGGLVPVFDSEAGWLLMPVTVAAGRTGP